MRTISVSYTHLDVYKRQHYYNTLKTTWSDIDFGVFEIPTFDGNPYAYNRYNGESTFCLLYTSILNDSIDSTC